MKRSAPCSRSSRNRWHACLTNLPATMPRPASHAIPLGDIGGIRSRPSWGRGSRCGLGIVIGKGAPVGKLLKDGIDGRLSLCQR